MTRSLDLIPRKVQANDNKVVGDSSDDKNLSKSKKLKNAKSGI